jgi:hypothetical protein
METVLVIVLGAMVGLVPIALVGAVVVMGVATVVQMTTAVRAAAVTALVRLRRGKNNEVHHVTNSSIVVCHNGHEDSVRGPTAIVCSQGHDQRR